MWEDLTSGTVKILAGFLHFNLSVCQVNVKWFPLTERLITKVQFTMWCRIVFRINSWVAEIVIVKHTYRQNRLHYFQLP